eukprot:1964782-Rhodomonas_salina.1
MSGHVPTLLVLLGEDDGGSDAFPESSNSDGFGDNDAEILRIETPEPDSVSQQLQRHTLDPSRVDAERELEAGETSVPGKVTPGDAGGSQAGDNSVKAASTSTNGPTVDPTAETSTQLEDGSLQGHHVSDAEQSRDKAESSPAQEDSQAGGQTLLGDDARSQDGANMSESGKQGPGTEESLKGPLDAGAIEGGLRGSSRSEEARGLASEEASEQPLAIADLLAVGGGRTALHWAAASGKEVRLLLLCSSTSTSTLRNQRHASMMNTWDQHAVGCIPFQRQSSYEDGSAIFVVMTCEHHDATACVTWPRTRAHADRRGVRETGSVQGAVGRGRGGGRRVCEQSVGGRGHDRAPSGAFKLGPALMRDEKCVSRARSVVEKWEMGLGDVRCFMGDSDDGRWEAGDGRRE